MSLATQPHRFDHLHESVRTIVDLPKNQRIESLQKDLWIGYPVALSILGKLESLLSHPRVLRMPNLLIVGDTNNGKSRIIEKFRVHHPATDTEDGESILAPVLVVQAPPVPDESRLYGAILLALSAPFSHRDRAEKKLNQIVKLLSRIETKILIIDEIHNILAGNGMKIRGVLNAIKNLGNELKISIVGAGTQDAYRAIQTDPQLSNRFEPAPLPRWNLDDDFMRLLVSFERVIPLAQPSDLTERSLAVKIHSLSEGLLGEVSSLLRKAAEASILDGSEKISKRLLDSVSFVPPSKRRWGGEGRGVGGF